MLIFVRQKYKFSSYPQQILQINAKKISANVFLAKFLQLIMQNAADFYVF